MAISSARAMTNGIDALLPLEHDQTDSFYTLSKNVQENTKQNIKMLLFTSPGERIMFPEYGVGLRRFLFENTPEAAIAAAINRQVKKYMLDQITITSLKVERGSKKMTSIVGQPNLLTIEMIYIINGYNIRDSIVVTDTLPG